MGSVASLCPVHLSVMGLSRCGRSKARKNIAASGPFEDSGLSVSKLPPEAGENSARNIGYRANFL